MRARLTRTLHVVKLFCQNISGISPSGNKFNLTYTVYVQDSLDLLNQKESICYMVEMKGEALVGCLEFKGFI